MTEAFIVGFIVGLLSGVLASLFVDNRATASQENRIRKLKLDVEEQELKAKLIRLTP